jgi:hypothetical protein
MEEIIRFDGVSKWSRNKQQFTDLTFTVGAGDFIGVTSDNLRVQYFLRLRAHVWVGNSLRLP